MYKLEEKANNNGILTANKLQNIKKIINTGFSIRTYSYIFYNFVVNIHR